MAATFSDDHIRKMDDTLDVRDASPMELYTQVCQVLNEIVQRDAVISIDRGDRCQEYDAKLEGKGPEAPAILKTALLRLAPAIVEADLGLREDRSGLSGRLTIGRNGDIYLDAEDSEEDWDHQHSVDSEFLEDVEFPGEPDGSASICLIL